MSRLWQSYRSPVHDALISKDQWRLLCRCQSAVLRLFLSRSRPDPTTALSPFSSSQAVNGFAGPGYIEIADQDDNFYLYDNPIILGKDDAEILTVSGTFTRFDGEALPSSTALFVYLDNDETQSDFARGQAELDASTGNFTISVTDFPRAFTRVILSFVVLDPADTPDNAPIGSVWPLRVVNNGCSEPLSITLEWDTDDTDLDLLVNEPGGERVFHGNRGGVSVVDSEWGNYPGKRRLKGDRLTGLWVIRSFHCLERFR